MLFNGHGFVFVIFGGILSAALVWLTKQGQDFWMYCWGALLISFDLVCRWRNNRKFFHPAGGGWLFLVPIWCAGLILIVLQITGRGLLEP